MYKFRFAVLAALIVMLSMGAAYSANVAMKISGPGAVNDSTIKAGQPVSFDVYIVNDTVRNGLAVGFKWYSPDSSITTVVHPVDSGNGMDNSAGDVHGWGPYEGSKTFDIVNRSASTNWDGALPDVMGIIAHVMKKKYEAHAEMKAYSFDLIIPTPGTIVVDSSFFGTGGTWMMVAGSKRPPHYPTWSGPYKYTVVK